VTGGQDSVAVRVPAHPLAQALIAAAGALVAPSANRFGRVSPTTAQHVRDELGDAVDYVLDGGPCTVGVESTIVSLLGPIPRILRPGGVIPTRIEAALAMPVEVGGNGVRAPGLLPNHYARARPLKLHHGAALSRRATALAELGHKVAVLALADAPAGLPAAVQWQVMPSEAAEHARLLYATLRALDAAGYSVLLVERPPESPDWLAVRDRLTRAAASFP